MTDLPQEHARESDAGPVSDNDASVFGGAPALVAELAPLLIARGWTITTAESCTGGLIAAALTDLAGSSVWFRQGVVSYANAAKTGLLGVPKAMLEAHGAVSEPVVRAMADGARLGAGAEIAIAVSGVAGPGGGSPDKPVGTVWIAWAQAGGPIDAVCHHFGGDRRAVRRATLEEALRGTIRRVLDKAGKLHET